MASTFEFYSLGLLVEDVRKDDPYVKVNPIETLPTTQGDAKVKEGSSGSFKTSSGGVDNFTANKSGTVTAKYIPLGNPNGTVPMMGSGEMVIICRYGGGDHFMWIPCSNSVKDRTVEHFLMMASAKPSRGGANSSANTYYVKADTDLKFLRLHTSNANGELATFDVELNGKDGLLTITDDKDNDIVIKSVAGEMDVNINNKVNVKTKEITFTGADKVLNKTKDFTIECSSFTVTNGANELIDVLCGLTDALANEVHIDSRGGNTQLSGGSKAAYAETKSKLESFKK